MRRSLSTWELTVANRLRAVRLDSIRNKILAFALFATLVPSLSTAWISYLQNRRSITAKITEQLRTLSAQAGREMDLWVKERVYDLRVFASSYEVTENIDRMPRARVQALARLNDYLTSVRDRFVDYEELLVLDPQGRVVATSASRAGAVHLPPEWQAEIRADNPVLGAAQWDPAAGKAVMPIAVPIRLGSGRLLGALTAKLNLTTMGEILRSASREGVGEAYLVTEQGGVIISSRLSSVDLMKLNVPEGTFRTLTARETEAVEFRGLGHNQVVGTLKRVPRLNWAVVVEIPASEAYRQVARLRNLTALIVIGLLVVVGGLAYVLGLLIVRPLARLTQGAAKVAGGDLDVDLPVVSGGEVGYLTEVFNNMVNRLREGREKLERLSVTDGLTGLYNRRRLMDALTVETGRSERHSHRFSLLMADVDHFKKYNDAYGHLAGDEVLTKVAAILRESVRDVDTAARYGGEEFAVLLPETGADGAVEVAERIRARLAQESFAGRKVTLSIGVAEFPEQGDTSELVIASADSALYDAKSAGRDQVVRATRKRTSKQQKWRASGPTRD